VFRKIAHYKRNNVSWFEMYYLFLACIDFLGFGCGVMDRAYCNTKISVKAFGRLQIATSNSNQPTH
jgi:hypothetical protein